MKENKAVYDPLPERRFCASEKVSGPLLFVKRAQDIPFGAVVKIFSADGRERNGQVIEVSEEYAVVQVFEETLGLDIVSTELVLADREACFGLSEDLIGRTLNGSGRPADGLKPIVPETYRPIAGTPMNPVSRAKPDDFIQTGISAIDGFNTLVRGQKLPIFSGSGLPGNEIAAQILKQAKGGRSAAGFVVVFAAIGITGREKSYFVREFTASGAKSRTIMFINTADDPTIERIMTPRFALTTAEFLAFEKGYDVLVVITDMTNYCEALREIGTAREEIPGRRGYPGYMYTDLASLYERAGRIKDRPGSVTMLPILTMPDDDITHPIADLTGYITEGQIFLSRSLHRRGIFPPVDVLRSLSRLMNNGIGEGVTREDHRGIANQLFACYASGQDIRRLTAIVGEEALSDEDRRYLKFADLFEQELINQGARERPVSETLDLGWKILSLIPAPELRRLSKDLVNRYYSQYMEDGVKSPYI